MMVRLILSMMLLCIVVLLNANTLIVRQDGVGNFFTIQSAINASNNGDIVLVHPGRYYENIDFIGKNITVASLKYTTDDPLYIGTTIIDGHRSGSCVKVMSGEQTARIIGFSITNGSGIYHYYSIDGGGIIVSQFSSLSIESCRVFKNETENGGGLYARLASVYLSDTSFFDNLATKGGGGIFLQGDTMNFNMDPINRCSIYNNYSGQGTDILSADIPSDIHVVVDTFTVLSPDRYYANTIENFFEDIYYYTFDIRHAFLTPVNHDLYVATNGDDLNDGRTLTSPLKTIAWAMHKVASDSLNPKSVHLSAGVYSTQTNQQKFPFSGKSFVNIEGQSQETTIIDGDNHYPMLMISIRLRNVNVKNITFRNFSSTDNQSAIFGGRSSHISFENTTISDCTSEQTPAMCFIYPKDFNFLNVSILNNTGTEGIAGVYLSGIDKANFKNCTFNNNRSYYADYGQAGALRTDTYNSVLVRNCIFSYNYDEIPYGGGACVFAPNDNSTPHYRVENSMFFENQSTYIDNHFIGRPIYFGGHGDFDIINCTFADNESPSAAVEICADSVNFWNCIFANNSPYEIFLLHPFEPNAPDNHVSINHCNVKGGINGIFNEDGWGTVTWQDGNIDGIPLFNYSNPDKPYELTAGSPCIDTGTADVPDGLYPYDLNGAPRVYGDCVDMGCYEFGSVNVDDNTTPVADVSNIKLYPNPFREDIRIEFVLPKPDDITIMIFNIRGQMVKTLTAGKMSAGPIQLQWNGKDDNGKKVASGVYFCRVEIPGHNYTKKMIRIH